MTHADDILEIPGLANYQHIPVCINHNSEFSCFVRINLFDVFHLGLRFTALIGGVIATLGMGLSSLHFHSVEVDN